MDKFSDTDPPVTDTPVSEDDWIIHSINIHGVFFERVCKKIIEDTPPWRVVSPNVPVEFPPPTDHSRGKESNLDIWARLRHRSGYDGGLRILSLLIECKKNNPEFVKWVFFPKQSGNSRKMQRQGGEQIAIRDVTMWHDPDSPKGWTVRPRIMRWALEADLPITDEARETRGSYKDHKTINTKTKTANTAISEAAYQVALGTQAIFLSESRYLINKFERTELSPAFPLRDMPWMKQFFLPVIVTSAQLFTCDFSPDDIDPISGIIPLSKPMLTERQELLFEYPLPRHLQAMPLFPQVAKDEGELDLFNRMHIRVVHSGYLPEFLKNLAKESDTFFDF